MILNTRVGFEVTGFVLFKNVQTFFVLNLVCLCYIIKCFEMNTLFLSERLANLLIL